MRTMKALIAAAAVGAVGFTTAMAQGPVYSVNVVGFVNVDLVAGYQFIANPLKGTNDLLSTILPVVPDGTTITPFDPVSQSYTAPATYLGGWDIDYTMPPGEGALIYADAPTKITFVGEVMQGNLTNAIVANYQLKASQVPQQGQLTSELSFQAQDGDVVYQFDPATQSFLQPNTYLGGWDSGDPVIKIGESFFLQRDPSTVGPNWTRTFNVQ